MNSLVNVLCDKIPEFKAQSSKRTLLCISERILNIPVQISSSLYNLLLEELEEEKDIDNVLILARVEKHKEMHDDNISSSSQNLKKKAKKSFQPEEQLVFLQPEEELIQNVRLKITPD